MAFSQFYYLMKKENIWHVASQSDKTHTQNIMRLTVRTIGPHPRVPIWPYTCPFSLWWLPRPSPLGLVALISHPRDSRDFDASFHFQSPSFFYQLHFSLHCLLSNHLPRYFFFLLIKKIFIHSSGLNLKSI